MANEMIKVEDLFVRDPFILIEEGVYYMLGTTKGSGKFDEQDLILYRSNDLKTFECVGQMVKPSDLIGYRDIWAPEMHRYGDKLYLILSVDRDDLGRGSIIFVADKITDKFVPLTGEYVTPAGWGCLDASMFVWKDKPYLYFSNEWTTPITGDGDGALYVAELSADLKTLVSKPRRIVSGKYCGFSVPIQVRQYNGYVAEGPYAVEENGKIALYWSTFTKTGYSVAKSVAEDVFAEYEFEKTIFDKDGGHCMIYTDLEGKEMITLHSPNTPDTARMISIELKNI